MGFDRRLRERRRGLLGGARGLVGTRHALRAAAVSGEEIGLARPGLGEAEEQGVLEVLRSGRLSLGPLLGECERRFAQRIGSPHASAVSSGTAGLHLALRAVGVSDGDEVITSPFSFVASANVAVFERATPVFADKIGRA